MLVLRKLAFKPHFGFPRLFPLSPPSCVCVFVSPCMQQHIRAQPLQGHAPAAGVGSGAGWGGSLLAVAAGAALGGLGGSRGP